MSYFPDGNQLNRQNQNNTQNDTEFFNMFKDTAYKLYPFERDASFTYNTAKSWLDISRSWRYIQTRRYNIYISLEILLIILLQN